MCGQQSTSELDIYHDGSLNSNVNVTVQGHRRTNVAKVVGVTSSEGFLVLSGLLGDSYMYLMKTRL